MLLRLNSNTDSTVSKMKELEFKIYDTKKSQDETTFTFLNRLEEVENAITTMQEKEEDCDDNDDIDVVTMINQLRLEMTEMRTEVHRSGNGLIASSGQTYYDNLVRERVTKNGESRKQIKEVAEELMNKDDSEKACRFWSNVYQYASQEKENKNTEFLPDHLERDLLSMITNVNDNFDGGPRIHFSSYLLAKVALKFDMIQQLTINGDFVYMRDGPNGSAKIEQWRNNETNRISDTARFRKEWRLGNGNYDVLVVRDYVYSLRKYNDVVKRRDDLLKNEISNNHMLYEVEMLAHVEKGIPTSLEMSHIHGDSRDTNPKNVNPEPGTDNKRRKNHSYCSCDCEERGLKKCKQSCGSRGCKVCS